ncbi:uncharacterized protein Gasu_33100 [Galdieria sulphuraria]|uniref:Uncharacterized protein n=1 Tax=Galdieria sulphuraria TaxID=130081 RepID=M2Y086_GALSU|nr:uncharacterized protein Gasu_33100 [Galdieria sulphuraria]EME29303.1 hypothetical protein Gasu_33100 [Galdieria sulphuraria]|eukprot:XP_005705823.1 hypothetical protein Gasu_33100 [Galdieria sulphuraria]
MFVHNMFPETTQENVSNFPEICRQQGKNKVCAQVVCPRPQRVSKALSALELQSLKAGESCFRIEEVEKYKRESTRPFSCPWSNREDTLTTTEPCEDEAFQDVTPPERTENPMVRDHWFLFSNRTRCGCAKLSECPAGEVFKHNANLRRTGNKSPALSV